jgi:hypothetical protein
VTCCPAFSQHRELLQSEDSTQIVWKVLKNLLLIRSLCLNIKWTSLKQMEKSNLINGQNS